MGKPFPFVDEIMTSYILCKWVQSSGEEPFEILSELDNLRNEIRKIEKFRSGKIGYASKSEMVNGTWLGIIPVPLISEITKSAEFRVAEIERQQFEAEWLKAKE